MKAAIFDMDGVLVDSEPLWKQAERSVYAEVGIELTDTMCLETIGLRPADAVAHWYSKYPWAAPSPEEVEVRLVAAVQELVNSQGQALPGVHEILKTLNDRELKLGLASGSPLCLIETVVEKLGIGHYFAVRCSAADEEHGKPDPAVYLTAAGLLDVDPVDCIAFEDSVRGIRSAQSAGMSVVAVPAAEQYDEAGFDQAECKLRSLTEFSLEMLEGFL